jgi:hypothetical protein
MSNLGEASSARQGEAFAAMLGVAVAVWLMPMASSSAYQLNHYDVIFQRTMPVPKDPVRQPQAPSGVGQICVVIVASPDSRHRRCR